MLIVFKQALNNLAPEAAQDLGCQGKDKNTAC